MTQHNPPLTNEPSVLSGTQSSASAPAKRSSRDGGYNLRKRTCRQSHSAFAIPLSRLEAMSVEIWESILKDITPSQLTIVAQSSKRVNTIVVNLPIWKHIAATAQLGLPASRGKRKTYFGLVVANSHRICERCHQSCRRVVVYEAPLPVFSYEHNKSIYLCLPCRRAHYDKHPEPVGPDDYVSLRNFYGGQVGIDAHKRRSRQIREKRDMRLQPSRNERRAYLESVFAESNLTVDDDDPDVLTFIRYASDNETYRRSWANHIMENMRQRRAMNRRRYELTGRLQEYGVELQNPMSLCQSYIDFDEGHIEDVVTMAVEMSWFVRETNYEVLRFYTSEDHYRRRGTVRIANVEHGKARALRAYVRQRLYLRRWHDVSLDQNLPARPPESLWWRIRSLIKSVWIEEAKNTILAAGVRESDELLQLDPRDASSLTFALFIRVLDRGAIACTAPLSDNESNTTPFSLALRSMVGEELFMEFIRSNLKSVMEMTLAMYVEGAMDNPPRAAVELVVHSNRITQDSYDEMERAFMETHIPEISRQECVHPYYLVRLLEKLKGEVMSA